MPKGYSKKAKKPRKEPEYRKPFTPHIARRYTDTERVAALVLLDINKGNVDQTARELGIPQQTMWTWATGSRHPEAQRLRQQYAGDMQTMARAAVYQLLDSVADENTIRRAPLIQRVQALGKTFEIMRTLEGKPSAIHVDGNQTVNVNLNLASLSTDELRAYLTITAKLRSSDGSDGASGTGTQGLPGVREEVVPGSLTGPNTDMGPGDGSNIHPLPSRPGEPDTATVDPDAARHPEIRDRDGAVPAVGVD